MRATRFRTTPPDRAVLKLYKEAMFGPLRTPPTGIEATHRVISDGMDTRSHSRRQAPVSASFEQWLRRQHPADVVRIILMLAAVGAVVLAIVRIG